MGHRNHRETQPLRSAYRAILFRSWWQPWLSSLTRAVASIAGFIAGAFAYMTTISCLESVGPRNAMAVVPYGQYAALVMAPIGGLLGGVLATSFMLWLGGLVRQAWEFLLAASSLLFVVTFVIGQENQGVPDFVHLPLILAECAFVALACVGTFTSQDRDDQTTIGPN